MNLDCVERFIASNSLVPRLRDVEASFFWFHRMNPVMLKIRYYYWQVSYVKDCVLLLAGESLPIELMVRILEPQIRKGALFGSYGKVPSG